ncbi:GFA family protein [Acinetobacter sp. YH01024]|uniref:GFA family protein n=1 Tax=Acinetobacter sp. YH01024 TaxID=2601037 RepID=UPI0015D0E512|nr:GFA family protein [Acinetobacter sp. YH01024]
MSYNGSCLCGDVQFQVLQDIHTIYHCHCSLCRKQSGTGANAASLIHCSAFQWRQGQEQIQSYYKASGFTSYFCSHCRSTLPNTVRNTDWIWIPLGLLAQSPAISTRLNFCLSSKTAWQIPSEADQSFDHLPKMSELNAFFKRQLNPQSKKP